jgi:hypothetical protein
MFFWMLVYGIGLGILLTFILALCRAGGNTDEAVRRPPGPDLDRAMIRHHRSMIDSLERTSTAEQRPTADVTKLRDAVKRLNGGSTDAKDS